jgi:alkylation response protein AidB-like acyl-CoA dehydrogenase
MTETTSDEVRRDVKQWLADHWDPGLGLLEWRTKLVESGWATPTWPAEWFGRGLPGWADPIVHDEFAAAGAVGTAVGGGMGLAAPTLLAHGSDEQKQRLLPRAITGEDTWCQLFSEPTNGSDLAGLATHAERDGDEWVVNGQKLWSTSAHHADLGLLLARTDPDVPKHRGISYFVLPMHQPGVEVRPVHQMNEHSSFNEVFLSDARVPAANLVGRPGDGWRIAMTTLAFERQFATVRAKSGVTPVGRAAEEAAAEAEEYFKTYAWYPQRAGRADLVQQVAELQGRTGDPIARQHMAGLVALRRAHEWTARRAQAARAAGRPPGSEGSLGKLAASRVAQASARTHSLLAGADGQLNHADSLLDGIVTEVLLSVPAQSIAGGTDEIQHNIIGEKVLDLPREPSVDRDIPYREIKRS